MNTHDYVAALKEELRNHKLLGLDEQAHQVEAEIKRATGGGKEKAVPASSKETTKGDG